MLGNSNVTVDDNIFEPALCSLHDLRWLLEHVEEPAVVALDSPLPPGVSKVRIETILTRLSNLETLRTLKGQAWGFCGDPEQTGYAAIVNSIERFLAWHDRCEDIKRRGGPAHPSQWQWDDTGHAAKYAIGSDSGELVRTEILSDGSRRAFGVTLAMNAQQLLQRDLSDVMPWVKSPNSDEIRADELAWETVDDKHVGTVTCSVCGHAEEYNTLSQKTKSMARTRMMRHLKNAKVEPNRHRILYSRASRTGK